jgi:hypothetical protein
MKIKQHSIEHFSHWLNLLRKPVTLTHIIALGSMFFAIGGVVTGEQHLRICLGALAIQVIRHCICGLMQKSN